MIKLYYYFLLIRPLNVFVSGLAMIISAAMLNRLNETLTIALITSVVMIFTAAANSLNDFIDLEIDKINRPSRPIPSKNINKKPVLFFSFILFIIGSILSLQLPPSAQFISIVLAMPLMVVYNTDLKSKPLIGNITVSLIIGFSFLFCGVQYVVSSISKTFKSNILIFPEVLLCVLFTLFKEELEVYSFFFFKSIYYV